MKATLSLSIEPPEPAWIDGPMPLRVTIANPTDDWFRLDVGFPAPSGLTVEARDPRVQVLPVEPMNLRFVPIELGPRGTWTASHELRRYVAVPGPGAWPLRVRFTAAVVRIAGDGSTEPAPALDVTRELALEVRPADPAGLASALAALERELAGPDRLQRAAAVESLTRLRAPAAIPALSRLAASADHAGPALVALAAIGTAEALAALAAALPAADHPSLLGALGALARAGARLPATTTRALLAGPPATQAAVLDHLAAAGDPGFDAEARALAAAPDPAVSAAARRYLERRP